MTILQRDSCYERPPWHDDEGIEEFLQKKAEEEGYSSVQAMLNALSQQNDNRINYTLNGGRPLGFDPRRDIELERILTSEKPYHVRLNDTLRYLNITLSDFAEKIGIRQSVANHILKGNIVPSQRIARHIFMQYNLKPQQNNK